MDFTFPVIALSAAIFVFAGAVKGLIGVGLPTAAIALLINVMPLSDAIPAILVPGLVSNIWQASAGGFARVTIRRFWLFLACMFIGTWFGVGVLIAADPMLMAGIFGVMLTIYSAFSLLRPAPPRLAPALERWLSPPVGLVNGFLSGMTGSYLMPGVLYMEALGLRRDELIQAMGIFFLCAIIALGVALAGQNAMSLSQAGFSALLLVPTMIGYFAGEYCRKSLPEQTFRKVFFMGLLGLGLYTAVTRLLA